MTVPTILSYGFRPFFLLAALWGGVAVPLWLLMHRGAINLAGSYGAFGWHAHELIFGYAAAVVCGFLFTAIPNWTGRFPVRGWSLAPLVALWCAGRIAMLAADTIGLITAALIDVLFLIAVAALAAREIMAGRNWRNLRVVLPVAALLTGNVLFHVAVLSGQPTDLALRLSIAALIALITLIGGRITPSFTRNWLVKQGAKRLPAPFDRLDAAAVAGTVLALVGWIASPASVLTAVLAIGAGVLLTVRLLRWRLGTAWREPLIAILHVGYAFVPAGFFLLGASVTWPAFIPFAAMIHTWTVGAIGTMTLAVMTRASLSHTGREPTASPVTAALYAAMLAAALLRVTASFTPAWYLPLLTAAGAAWSISLLGFALVYGPMLATERAARAVSAG